jgi:uncharacterized protein YigE (DUF2233 family)
MYRLLVLCTLLLTANVAEAQLRFDTLSTRPIGPGMTHVRIVEHTQPWNINVIEVDLTNPHVQMRAMAAQNRVGGRETVSGMVARQEQAGHRVVAAINGDFFTTSYPVATHIQEGEMAYEPVTRGERPGIGFSSDNMAMVEMPFLNASLSFADTSVVIDGVNKPRADGELVLYNRYRGSGTGTTSDGSEIAVRAIDDWAVNATVRVVVEEVRGNSGNTPIAAGEAVLSGQGSRGAFLANHLSVGDTLSVNLGARPGLDNLTEMISGGPFIVVDGQVDVGPRGDGVDRHPRTAVGIDADGSRLYMVTVDGRQGASAGVTLTELAEWMVSVGIDRAMNLDGGGSTTLLVHGEVENLLQGSQRAVANGLAVISTAPQGEFAGVRARQRSLRIFRSQSFTFDVDGVDEYFHPAPYDESLVEFSVDEQLGSVDSDGLFVAGDDAAVGNLYVTYGSFVDTVQVVVTDIAELDIQPGSIITDTTRTFSFSYRAFDSDGRQQYLQVGDVVWSVVDPDLGTIDETGRFRGLRAGVTDVVATYKSVTDTVQVEILVVDGVTQLDSFDSLEDWNIVLDNVDADGSDVSVVELDDGSRAFQVDYRFTHGSASVFRILLRKDIEVQGVPELVHLDVASDGLNHRVFFELEDAIGQRLTAYVPRWINQTEFDSLAAPAYWSGMVHPLTIRGMGIQLGNTGVAGAVNEGTLLLKDLRVSYPQRSAVSVEPGAELPAGISLEQNYPNPFNPSTTIRYSISEAGPVSVRVYDVLGRLVSTLVDAGQMAAGTHEVTWNADGPDGKVPSGVYFYVLEAGNRHVTRSMVLLK